MQDECSRKCKEIRVPRNPREICAEKGSDAAFIPTRRKKASKHIYKATTFSGAALERY